MLMSILHQLFQKCLIGMFICFFFFSFFFSFNKMCKLKSKILYRCVYVYVCMQMSKCVEGREVEENTYIYKFVCCIYLMYYQYFLFPLCPFVLPYFL